MIRMNDFTAEPDELRREELAAVESVFRSGRFILGPEVEKFEEAWAKFCQVKSCAGVANGMDAIELGLRALDIGPGDEVITTPMTAIATVLAIIHAGATPVLADINRDTALLDPASAERCITPRTKAILLVHLYGQVGDMEPWLALCKKANIHLLEDCAHAHGAGRNGRMAGSFGSWGAYSFYPTKNLGARGDAGALVTNSSEIASRVKTLRNYGTSERYEHAEAGLNSRLDELQAAILSVRLNWLEQFNEHRRDIAAQYLHRIKSVSIGLPHARNLPARSHVFHLFVIRCTARDRLAEFLKAQGIETLVHYPIPAHQQACCKNVQRDPAGLPAAEAHARQCLSLPCHPQLRADDVATIISAVNLFT